VGPVFFFLFLLWLSDSLSLSLSPLVRPTPALSPSLSLSLALSLSRSLSLSWEDRGNAGLPTCGNHTGIAGQTFGLPSSSLVVVAALGRAVYPSLPFSPLLELKVKP
jgi:hypothetical protein